MWFTILAGLAFLPFVLKTLFPYFGQDLSYLLTVIGVGMRIRKYTKTKPFYSIVDCFLDAVKKHPHKTFVHFEGEAHSYAEADRQSNKVARALRSVLGLAEGDTVALFLGNQPGFVWTWLGLAKLGCPAAFLNTNIRSRSLLHSVACCGAKALIVAPELSEAIEEVVPALGEQGVLVFLLDHPEAGSTAGITPITPLSPLSTPPITPLSHSIAEASDLPLSPDLRSKVTIKSPALYIYTSGTTGLPKAALVTHERVWGASCLQDMSGVTSEDVFYLNLPLYHSAGFLIGLTGSIQRGNTIVLKKKFSASQFWDDCRKYDVTVMQYIGETMRYLCHSPKKDNDRDHKVRVAIGNGVRADVWREFLERFGPVQVRELYSATESNIGLVNYTSKVGVVGRANVLHRMLCPYTVVRFDIEKEEPLRNAEGLCIEAARGETGLMVGKITKRAPFIGYAGNQQQTEKKRLRDVLQKGDLYFNTGDLMRIDHDNFIYFMDRVGDTFRWKGENVATSEVADILTMVDCIVEANVYGVKVEGHEGRTGMAAVTLKEGEQLDCDATFKQVATYLPAYARPRFLRIQDSLELTGTFKMKKVKLVEEGFNPAGIRDALYFLDSDKKAYVPLTQEIYTSIHSREIKL